MDQLLPPEAEIQKLLAFTSSHEASDLHLKVGYAPYVRIGGHLRKLQMPAIPDTGYVDGMFKSLVPGERWRDFENTGSVDFSTAIETGDRFRINLFRSRGEVHAAIRRVQAKILNFDDLNLPEIYRKSISETLDGLILVCGVTGSGKSSMARSASFPSAKWDSTCQIFRTPCGS